MHITIDQIPGETRALSDAGQNLLLALTDSQADSQLALRRLESATTRSLSTETRLRFEASHVSDKTLPAIDEDLLADVLLDAQSANLLMAAAIATNEHDGSRSSEPLRTVLDDIDNFRRALSVAPERLRFAAESLDSDSLPAARDRFRTSAQRATRSVLEGTSNTIQIVIDNISLVDPAKVLAAIDSLGKTLPITVGAGRFARAAVERLKSLIEKISVLFGAPALAGMQNTIRQVWHKIEAGEYTRDLLSWLMDTQTLGGRIEQICSEDRMRIGTLDGCSRDLSELDDRYGRVAKVLNGLASAVVIAAGLAAYFTALATWVVPLSAAAYVAVIAAALVAAAAFFDKGPLFGGVRGLREIVQSASVVSAAG